MPNKTTTAATIDVRGNWRLYWGQMPLPEGSAACGTVKRRGELAGALIRLASGAYVQGNAGAIRTLPLQDSVASGAIHALLREAREAAGLTQVKLADRLGLTQSNVSAYESGRIVPSLEQLERIASACGHAVAISLNSRP